MSENNRDMCSSACEAEAHERMKSEESSPDKGSFREENFLSAARGEHRLKDLDDSSLC